MHYALDGSLFFLGGLSSQPHLLSFSLDDEKESKYLAEDLRHDLYLKGFLQNLYLRPSCHQCKFCKANRPVDITLADYWGVKQDLQGMYDGKGTSLVILHSEKGKEAFARIGGRKKKADFSQAISHNSSMIRPCVPSKHRALFFRALASEEEGIEVLLERYTRLPMNVRLKKAIRRIPGVAWLGRSVKGVLGFPRK